jgi:hypothetical protein
MTLQLPSLDARLAYLAVQYHLSRPGSELDPESKQPVPHGLREIAQALEPQLERAVAAIDPSASQRHLLIEAAAGAVNELKSYPLIAAGGRPTAASFHEALRRLFPEVAGDPDEATALAGHMLALRRKLERLPPPAAAEAPAAPARSRWRFWERRGA